MERQCSWNSNLRTETATLASVSRNSIRLTHIGVLSGDNMRPRRHNSRRSVLVSRAGSPGPGTHKMVYWKSGTVHPGCLMGLPSGLGPREHCDPGHLALSRPMRLTPNKALRPDCAPRLAFVHGLVYEAINHIANVSLICYNRFEVESILCVSPLADPELLTSVAPACEEGRSRWPEP